MKAFLKGNPQREFHQRFASQSAMEYLMTYGWAILIIAVVLAALFELGVFNPMTFAPKASPGSCKVVRPDGPSTTNFISLSGECNGEIPQYVASFSGSGSILVPASTLPNGGSPRTITAWINPSSESGNSGIFYYGGVNCDPNGAIFGLVLNGADLYLWGSCDDYNTGKSIPLNTWSFVAVNYTGSAITQFYDGNPISGPASYTSETCNSITCTNAFIGGASGWWGGQFSGDISNVQIYNTALSANDIQALYQEGIGGASIKIQNLVGWWPLNGNANDYSGNGNNGVPSGVTYTSNWYSGYSAP